ncbi:protein transport protein Sec31A isoform X2 [Maniola jurtina]|uniref:protein transport protein Sec31A isoform X2 n=1 Tax=Maniola jurtina TaxID=191418 RepID=UPI001E6860FD|nr:protein transport protein Sec31A isoform X2 [Maniola jurtina]
MKIKELKRTVNTSWSPPGHYPSMIVTGSAAQQVDANFSSNSYLELYALNLSDSSPDLELKSSIQTKHKFQKLAWSGAGIIVGGCDGGLLEFYSAENLLNKASEPLVGSTSKHNGNVSALDINPYQKNLLASGASDSEIFIWDLNNTSQPMAPGNRSQPYDHVQGLAWNQQVQHILGSTFATRCLVWDLRKNEPIMKLSDSQFRTRWRSLAWHPAVATQLCIASEDDQAPVIQLWDLRLAASPLVTLEGHEKGALSLSWSRHDHDLLLSGGKDGRILAWNPNNTKPGGELVVEVSRQSAWVFDVSWSPRDPGLLSAAAFDQSLAVHTLLHTGTQHNMSASSQSNIMESFGGADSFAALPVVQQSAPVQTVAAQPTRAPKWLKRPTGAKFAFGGKLVTFERCPQEEGPQKMVYISQVVSEPEIVEKAFELDTVIGLTLSQEPGAAERLAEYCREKGDAASDQQERYTWFFLRANFMSTFRSEVLNLLGFKQDEIPSKFKSQAAEARAPDLAGLSRGESTETEAELSTDTSTDLSDAQTLIERKLASVDLEPAVDNVVIPNGEDPTSLICRALVCGNLEEAVELCLEAKRIADALIIASLGSQELLYKVQKYHLNKTASDPVSLVSGSLLRSKWDTLIQAASPNSWRDTLAALVTHCEGDSLAHYCEMLGDKLSQESDEALRDAGALCYVCAAHGDALAARALRGAARDISTLAKCTELALLTKAAAAARGRPVQPGGKLETLLSEYGARLASQGCLQSALAALQGATTELNQRLMVALGMRPQKTVQQQPQQAAARTRTVSSHSQSRGQFPAHNDVNAYNAAPAPETAGWVASAMPPRPPSVSSQPGGKSGRSKYKVDPSVQSAPLYNQYGYNNPIQSQPTFGYNSPLPDQYGSASVPSHNFTPINQPNPINPLNPINSLNPINPLNPAPLNPTNPINPLNTTPLNPMNPLNPAVNGGYYNNQHVEPAVAASPPSKPVPPGWNDPPMMTSKPKPKQETPQPQAPITHPLFGVEPPQHIALAPTSQYDQTFGQQPYQGQGGQYPNQQAQFPGQQAQFPGQQAQIPGQQAQFPGQQAQFPSQQGFPGQNQFPGQQYEQQYQQYPQGMQPGYPQQVESPAPVEAAPVQKGPIPEEHAVLQSALDSLRHACSERAANPQMKRKLEDVQRRLETLYDMLRENRLSESALSSLHSCVQLVQAGDHHNALSAVTALATGPDFAAVAAFLPGLKMLFLLAQQLQVCAR